MNLPDEDAPYSEHTPRGYVHSQDHERTSGDVFATVDTNVDMSQDTQVPTAPTRRRRRRETDDDDETVVSEFNSGVSAKSELEIPGPGCGRTFCRNCCVENTH